MYEEFYGLTEKPFSIQPDPSFLYWGRGHRLAYAMLEYGVVNHAGISVITGDVGCGKTTLIHRLLEQLSDTHSISLLSNIQQGRGDLLSWVLMGFGQPFSGMSHVEQFAQIQRFFIDEYRKGRRVVLVIDEAQNLSSDMLEELRMLSNINAGKDQLLQLILAGQPQLKEILNRPEMLQLAQRVGSDFHLTPLTRKEVHAYIDTRLSIAGAKHKIFSESAMDVIAHHSNGVPRVINIMADTALVYGFSGQETLIDEAIVNAVVRDKVDYGVFGLASGPVSTAPEIRSDASSSFLRPEPARVDTTRALRPAAPDPQRRDEGGVSKFFKPRTTSVEPSLAKGGAAAAARRLEPALAQEAEADLMGQAEKAALLAPEDGHAQVPRFDPMRSLHERTNTPAAADAPQVDLSSVAVILADVGDGSSIRALAERGAGRLSMAVAGGSEAREALQAAERAGIPAVELNDPMPTLGRARNAAYRRLKKARSDFSYVQFVQPGDTLTGNWLSDAIHFLERRPEVAAVEGLIAEPSRDAPLLERMKVLSRASESGEISWAGGTALFRCEAFEAAGGFRGELLGNETEDLSIRLRRRGAHIWRLDKVMAERAAGKGGLGEWWRASREAGFVYAAGAALYGGPPERFHVTENARAIMWGMLFPLLALVLAVIVASFAAAAYGKVDPLVAGLAVILLAMLVYVAKIAVIAFRNGAGRGLSWAYGLFSTLGHFPEYLGVTRYWKISRQRGLGARSRAAGAGE